MTPEDDFVRSVIWLSTGGRVRPRVGGTLLSGDVISSGREVEAVILAVVDLTFLVGPSIKVDPSQTGSSHPLRQI